MPRPSPTFIPICGSEPDSEERPCASLAGMGMDVAVDVEVAVLDADVVEAAVEELVEVDVVVNLVVEDVAEGLGVAVNLAGPVPPTGG